MTIIGCGAIGADVAQMLANAGVGRLTLIDHDILGWDNIGRHLLGAAEVGGHKAERLAKHLSRQFPHLTIQGVITKWQDMVEHQIESIFRSDVILSLTGDWPSDSRLNTSIRSGFYPPLIFGWTEPHGIAGHALLVGARGGCLACGRNQIGVVTHRVTEWQEGTLKPLPACGGFFEPHGAVETGPIKAMISSLALDALKMSPPIYSELRTWIGDTRRLGDLGGTVSKAWMPRLSDDSVIGQVVRQKWPVSSKCRQCAE